MYAGRYCSVPRAGSDSNRNYECLEHDLQKVLWELAHKKKVWTVRMLHCYHRLEACTKRSRRDQELGLRSLLPSGNCFLYVLYCTCCACMYVPELPRYGYNRCLSVNMSSSR